MVQRDWVRRQGLSADEAVVRVLVVVVATRVARGAELVGGERRAVQTLVQRANRADVVAGVGLVLVQHQPHVLRRADAAAARVPIPAEGGSAGGRGQGGQKIELGLSTQRRQQLAVRILRGHNGGGQGRRNSVRLRGVSGYWSEGRADDDSSELVAAKCRCATLYSAYREHWVTRSASV